MCLVVLLTVGVASFERYSGAPDRAKDCVVHLSPAPPVVDRAHPVAAARYPGRLSQGGGTVGDAYLSQQVNTEGNLDMESLTRQLIGVALDHGGTFHLPCQQHYTPDESSVATPGWARSSRSSASTTRTCCS